MNGANVYVGLGRGGGEHTNSIGLSLGNIKELANNFPERQRFEINREADSIHEILNQSNSKVVSASNSASIILVAQKKLSELLNKVKSTYERMNEKVPQQLYDSEHKLREELDNKITNAANPVRAEKEEKEKDWYNDYWKQKLSNLNEKKAKVEELAKQSKSFGWKNLSQIIGATLVGGGAIANYISQNNAINARKEMYKDMEKHAQELQKEANADPNNSNKRAAANAAVKDLEREGRKNLLEEASKLTRDYLNQRQKAATDIGLNFGNFAKIFGSDKNMDSLKDIRDVDRMMNLQTKKFNNYL
jgi:hypothetical protein